MNGAASGKPTSAALTVNQVTATYGFGKRAIPTVHSVTFDVLQGHTLGVVGESGSGKSTLAKVITGRLKPTSGSVGIAGVDVYRATREQRRTLRREVQMVPQDPYASLDPRMPIGRSLVEAISPTGRRSSSAKEAVSHLLEMVSLDPSVAVRFPHAFSGGQRQRIAIARALAVQPTVLIADEITSALDASIQFEVLNLLLQLQQDLGFACVFITHNLGVAARMCNELIVMRHGRVVEQGSIDILGAPREPYTRTLVASVPDRAGHFLASAPSTDVHADLEANPGTGS